MKIRVNVFFNDGPSTRSRLVTRSWNELVDNRLGPPKIGSMETWPLRIIPSVSDHFEINLNDHSVDLFVTNRRITKDEIVIDTSCSSIRKNESLIPGFSRMNPGRKQELFLTLEFQES
jgi:hypothetical protein